MEEDVSGGSFGVKESAVCAGTAGLRTVYCSGIDR